MSRRSVKKMRRYVNHGSGSASAWGRPADRPATVLGDGSGARASSRSCRACCRYRFTTVWFVPSAPPVVGTRWNEYAGYGVASRNTSIQASTSSGNIQSCGGGSRLKEFRRPGIRFGVFEHLVDRDRDRPRQRDWAPVHDHRRLHLRVIGPDDHPEKLRGARGLELASVIERIDASWGWFGIHQVPSVTGAPRGLRTCQVGTATRRVNPRLGGTMCEAATSWMCLGAVSPPVLQWGYAVGVAESA